MKVQYVFPPRGPCSLGAPTAFLSKNESEDKAEAAARRQVQYADEDQPEAAARRQVQYADDFSVALRGLHAVAEPKPALRRVGACECKVDPGPAETPISKKMRRLLKDLRTVDATMHELQIDRDCLPAPNHTAPYQDGADVLAITSQFVPRLALTRKAAHSSHMRLPRHISALLRTSLAGDPVHLALQPC
eukprot:CAMPEP_0173079512 /NCGR_PEP_ID=MMETSP1102-20130122/15206_1 /TAXON_ID=49646 /ORGANISM="Geminigera sp., Strain Caron Lab Isolate" /LENGTH=189 /DNA_ID=CAMNT_0013951885 /DNA_START=90 /DNA_END=659 /DNA_ORIENTATION=+